MPVLDINVCPLFAALLPGGKILLELAVGDDEHLVKVTMPASEASEMLAAKTVTTLDLDVLPHLSPRLAREIEEFVGAIRRRLIERAAAPE